MTAADAATKLAHLSEAQRQTVRAIIDAVVPQAQVFLFGSRATARARPYSDLDLLFVVPARLSWQQRADLGGRFEASDLPFRVDVVEDSSLEPGMRARVHAERLAL